MSIQPTMTLKEAVLARHSVRRFLDRPIEAEKVEALEEAISAANAQSGLRITLVTEEPEAFQAGKPHYGSFSGCRNYIAMIGRKGDDEAVGYFGEGLVLLAQRLGLNTCWVALTYEKGKVPLTLAPEEKIFDLIALGYGETQGVPHKSKPAARLFKAPADAPAWFAAGAEAALLAPTAVNQQAFRLTLTGPRTVSAKALIGPCVKTDLGIIKCHFEIGAGKENFEWA